jgi:hypothetical protein
MKVRAKLAATGWFVSSIRLFIFIIYYPPSDVLGCFLALLTPESLKVLEQGTLILSTDK